MSQNIYDDPEFFAGYAQLPRSQQGLAAAPEWPSLQAMLPDLNGLNVLDLGCGYGWFCRNARQQGANQVLGIDLSRKMLDRAEAMTDDPSISYRLDDLANLSLPERTFDVAYSSLALHYLPDLTPLLNTVHQALKPGGRLVFSTEHPIYTCPTDHRWLTDDQGTRYWAIHRYQDEGQRTSDWLAPGVVKYHRTLATTLNAVMAAGFTLRHVDEWGPSAEQMASDNLLIEEAERPMFVLISAQR